MTPFRITVPDGVAGRLDAVLASLLDDVPRSQLKQRISEIAVDARPAKLSARVAEGAVLTGMIAAPTVPTFEPENIPLAVIAEADSWVAIHKPQGMVVHPGNGNRSGTMVHALAWRYRDDPFFRGEVAVVPTDDDAAADDDPVDDGSADDTSPEPFRPGIVHRLDKDTSGVMIVARTERAHRWLSEQFAARTVEKRYLAIVSGVLPYTSGWISAPIGRDTHHRIRFSTPARGAEMGRGEPGPDIIRQMHVSSETDTSGGSPRPHQRARRMRSALTAWRTLRTVGGYSLVELHPYTGRTHQLRVHMKHLGMPIVGDPLYARPDRRLPTSTLMLHAYRLGIVPEDGAPFTEFTAPAPARFGEAIRTLAADTLRR